MSTYQGIIHTEQGAKKRVFPTGTELETQSGSTVDFQAGTTLTNAATVARSGAETVTGATTYGAAASIVTLAGCTNKPPFATRAASWSATAAESSQVILITASGVTCTLPATVSGLTYTFISTLVGAGFAISPNASDKINGGTDDKDLINTGATGKANDTCTIVGDGSVGWYAIHTGGVWDDE
jgi:hypothetical protein